MLPSEQSDVLELALRAKVVLHGEADPRQQDQETSEGNDHEVLGEKMHVVT